MVNCVDPFDGNTPAWLAVARCHVSEDIVFARLRAPHTRGADSVPNPDKGLGFEGNCCEARRARGHVFCKDNPSFGYWDVTWTYGISSRTCGNERWTCRNIVKHILI